MSPEENNNIVIEWCYYQNGRGIVAAADSKSATWVKTFAAGFLFGTDDTKAWARWERADAIVYHTFLH